MKITTTIYTVAFLLSIAVSALFFALRTDADVAVGTTLQSEIHAIQRYILALKEIISQSVEESDTILIRQIVQIPFVSTLSLQDLSVSELVAQKPVVSEPVAQKPRVAVASVVVQEPANREDALAQEIARAVHKEVNAVRYTYGTASVTDNRAIASVALGHSIDMQKNNYFAHVDLQGRKPLARFGGMQKLSTVTGCHTLYSENLALLTTGAYYQTFVDGVWQLDSHAVAERVVQMWMESTQGHRENMLMTTHRLSGIGVAVSVDQVYGYKIYVTQNFCS